MGVVPDPWRALAEDPREHSAFLAWSSALASSGSVVTPLGSPDNQRAQYERLFELLPGELTVDAHVMLDQRPWFVDHTILPAPQSQRLPAAVREATEHLTRALAGAVLRSPTGSLGVSVNVRHLIAGRRAAREYCKRLVRLSQQAADSGLPVFDTEDPDLDPVYPMPAVQPIPLTRPHEPIQFVFENHLKMAAHYTSEGWVNDTSWLRDHIAERIRKKLRDDRDDNGRAKGQLCRARAFGATGLLIDARRGWEDTQPITPLTDARLGWPKRDPVIELPPDVIADLVRNLALEYPGVLNAGWLLTNGDHVTTVYWAD
jgi:hypothetical protein